MKNLPNQIQNDLKQLKAIKPDAAWLEANKNSLLAALTFAKNPERSLSYVSVASLSFKQLIARLAWQPVGIALMVLGVIAGPSIAAVNAAKGSLPGDALYPVKRSLERARLSLTLSSTKKAQLEVGLVSNRLHELQRLTKEQAPGPARQQKIAIAIEELKKDTATVKTRLDAAKQETGPANAGQAVALAKIIDEKTSDYQQTLDAALAELDPAAPEAAAGTLTQAVTTVQDVSLTALDVLVKTDASSQGALTPEELEPKVKSQLEAVKKAASSLQGQLAPAPVMPVEDPEPTAGTEQEAAPNEPEAPAAAQPKEEPTVTAPAIIAEVSPEAGEDPNAATPGAEVDAAPETEPVPAPTIEEQRQALQKQLEADILPQITYAEELINLKDFATALDTLNKVNKKIEEISNALAALLGTQPQPQLEPPASEPSSQQSSVETPAPEVDEHAEHEAEEASVHDEVNAADATAPTQQ